jgi:hypothetical protein
LIAARGRLGGVLRPRGGFWDNGIDLGCSLSCGAADSARLEIVDRNSDDDGEGGKAETSDCVETHIG